MLTLLSSMTEAQKDTFRADQFGPGQVFYVNGANLVVGGPEVNRSYYTTIAQALTHCTPYRNDVIVVMQGHVETIDGSPDQWGVHGVKIIGRGNKATRPIIRISDGAAVQLELVALDMTFENMWIEAGAGTAANTTLLDLVGAGGLTLRKCGFRCKEREVDFKTAIQCTDVSLTDLASSDPWTTITSAAALFKSWMVGYTLEITGAGTNFSTGRYTIIAVNSTSSITVDRAAGSTGAASDGEASISNANNVTIEECTFDNETSDASPQGVCAIRAIGITEGWKIVGNQVRGSFSVALIDTTVLKSYDFDCLNNDLLNRQTANVTGGIDLVASTTGKLHGNVCKNLYASAIQCYDVGACDVGVNYEGNELAKRPKLYGTEDT